MIGVKPNILLAFSEANKVAREKLNRRHCTNQDVGFCEGFRMPAHDDGATHSGAGVRKPPREETAGGVAWWRVRRYGDLAAVRLSVGTTFAIWHELCEWVKTPFAAPVISKSYAL